MPAPDSPLFVSLLRGHDRLRRLADVLALQELNRQRLDMMDHLRKADPDCRYIEVFGEIVIQFRRDNEQVGRMLADLDVEIADAARAVSSSASTGPAAE